MGRVFINYRRALNFKDAQLLQAQLERHFGADGVFLDVSGLEGGDHWLRLLDQQVNASKVMAVLIGKGWLDTVDEAGQRRLDNPNDFVRYEITCALSREIPVLPILIDGAGMPDIVDLPRPIANLASLQAMAFRTESARDDADKIAKRLKYLIDTRRSRKRVPYWVAVASSVAAFVLGVITGPSALIQAGLPILGIDTSTLKAYVLFDMRSEERGAQDAGEAALSDGAFRTLDGQRMKELRDATEAAIKGKAAVQQQVAALEQEVHRLRAAAAEGERKLAAYEGRPEDTAPESTAAVAPTAPSPAKVAAVAMPPATKADVSLLWPVTGKIIREFGPRTDGSHSDGLEIGVPLGTDVVAADDGFVMYAGSELKGYGKLVLVRHDNGWVTAYGYNDELLVKRGDHVARGQPIAKSGRAPEKSEPSLHFELRQGAKPVDPVQYLR